MRVLILSQFFTPEPDLKCLPLAIELKSRGYEVEVLTGYPNYPIGKIYPGYKMRVFHAEYIEDIKVIRVPLFIDHSTSSIKRALNYITFALSATFLGILKIKKPDIIYAYHAPATIAIPAIVFKFVFRSKIYYDINDYWPDTLTSSGMLRSQFLLKAVGLYCKLSYRFFDNINVVSNGFKKKLLQLNVPEERISVIYNWSLPINNEKSVTFESLKELFKDNFTIVYAGNIGKAQSLEVIIRAALEIKARNIRKIKFILVGDGVEKKHIEYLTQKCGLQDIITLTGQVKPNNVGSFLEAADILLLHLKDDILFEITIPSKLGAYFHMSKPILCGVKGETAAMVKQSKSGLCFEPDNHMDFFDKIMEIKSLNKEELLEMGRKGNEYYHSELSFDVGVKNINNIFERLVNVSKNI